MTGLIELVSIHITRGSNKSIRRFKIAGHALFDEKGRDIVCAAVSAIAYTTLGGLTNVAAIPFNYDIREGSMVCDLSDEIDGEAGLKAETILETMVIGLRQIEKSYPGNITVIEEEV